MNEIHRQAADQAIATVANKATYTGAATSGAGWALSNEFIAMGGFVLAVMGYVTTLFFKIREDRRQSHFRQKEDQRKQTEHEAAMREIKQRQTVTTRLSRLAEETEARNKLL